MITDAGASGHFPKFRKRRNKRRFINGENMKMTTELNQKRRKIEMRVDRARDAIFASVSETNVPFNRCFAIANYETREEYNKATEELAEFEREMMKQGRAYKFQYSSLVFYN